MSLAIHTDQTLVRRLKEMEPFIGNTPLFPIKHIFRKKGIEIYAKLEWQQLSKSVKARAGFNIIKHAILSGQISRKKGLIDASSGNTGVAYATIGAALGIPVTLCIPENISQQKKTTLLSKGVNIIYTSKFGTTDEAQLKAKELAQENPDQYFYTDQYSNEHNWKAHYNGTAHEIWNQTNQKITHFIAGLGTTGTFVGTSKKLKVLNSNINVTSLQPETAMHGLEGWKHLDSAIVPKIYDDKIADENQFIDTMTAYNVLKDVAKHEGLLISPSGAANLAGAITLAEKIEKGVIVTTFADHGTNYQEVLDQIL